MLAPADHLAAALGSDVRVTGCVHYRLARHCLQTGFVVEDNSRNPALVSYDVHKGGEIAYLHAGLNHHIIQQTCGGERIKVYTQGQPWVPPKGLVLLAGPFKGIHCAATGQQPLDDLIKDPADGFAAIERTPSQPGGDAS